MMAKTWVGNKVLVPFALRSDIPHWQLQNGTRALGLGDQPDLTLFGHADALNDILTGREPALLQFGENKFTVDLDLIGRRSPYMTSNINLRCRKVLQDIFLQTLKARGVPSSSAVFNLYFYWSHFELLGKKQMLL